MTSDFNYSEHIRRARTLLGFSQESFAQALNVSPRTVARWEAGDSAPSSATHRIDLAHCFVAANMDAIAWELNSALDAVLTAEGVSLFLAAGRDVAVIAETALLRVRETAWQKRARTATYVQGHAVVGNPINMLSEMGADSSVLGAGSLSYPLWLVGSGTIRKLMKGKRGKETATAMASQERTARVYQTLSNCADTHQIDFKIFVNLISEFANELQRNNLSLDDVKMVVSSN